MSSNDRQLKQDDYFNPSQPVTYLTDGAGIGKVVETKTVQQPGQTITYSNQGTDGYFGYPSSQVFGQPRSSNVEFKNAVVNREVITTGNNQLSQYGTPTYVTTSTTQQPSVIRTVQTQVIEQPVQIVKTVTTTEQPKTIQNMTKPI